MTTIATILLPPLIVFAVWGILAAIAFVPFWWSAVGIGLILKGANE